MGAPASEAPGGSASGAGPLREAGGDWRSTLPGILAAAGSGISVDRCYVFQNRRGPDGRLWMDLCGEWDAPGIRQLFEDPRNHLHPYYPDFQRWIDVMGDGREIVETIDGLSEPEHAVLRAEGTAATMQVPVMVDGEWWGFVGIDLCTARPWTAEDQTTVHGLVRQLEASVVVQRALEDERLHDDLFRSVVEHGPAVTYIDAIDDSASSIYVSPQIETLLGYAPEEWCADPELWPRALHPDDRARALAENARHNETGEPFRLEYRMFTKDGRVVWVHDAAQVVLDERGMPRYSHGVMIDITERKRTEEEVAFQAYHDELTGLPSRAMFEELLELSVSRARRHDGSVAVIYIDLNDFSLVNDSLGHQAGDALLISVAERLREATRETDLVARRGGDQFLLLLADLAREDGGIDGAVMRAESVASKIQESLMAPFAVDGTEVYLAASIGISLFPDDAADSGSLQRNAESAMWEAKKSGRVGYVVAAGGALDSSAKLRFVTRLRKAVEAQRWVLHYQPVVDLEHGRMVGVEALIRWIEPDGTLVPPAEFIPLAEELGLIEQIGSWVVRELTYQVQAWRELDIDLEVGFNLSPRQFWQPDLARRIQQEFRSSGVDPSRVLVEVTETSAMLDPDRAQEILSELHAAGFSIAIDDFGTGYSSLSRLREMPVRVLKIDRSFVAGVHEDRQSASIVAAFLELANGLDMTTLAEGIETAEELAFLREHGCALGQGYYFSRPVPPEEIIAYAFGGIPAALALGSA
ncbi:MAG TPA: EAL domain-containing protein [Actinomycetota bacterium]|nr:EAL domain-containing protein [Actinomycetota bacterium]